MLKLKFSTKGFWPSGQKLNNFIGSRGFSLVCQSTETHNTETKERVRDYGECSNISRYTWLSNKNYSPLNYVVKYHFLDCLLLFLISIS